MSDDRLTRAQGEDDARLLDAAVCERFSVAAADIRLPASLRLTEWQRAVVSGLAAKAVKTIEDELRSSLLEAPLSRGNEALRAALASTHVEIAGPVLEKSGKHPDDALTTALIRRAEEHRLARTRGSPETALLLDLINDQDEGIAGEATSILIGHSRRFDRFSEPVAATTELAAEVQHRLVWRVAAALRTYMVDWHGIHAAAADEAVVAAAERLLANYDEGDSLEARAARLVRRLRDAGRLDDRIVARALIEGSLPLFLAAIAARASLSFGAAWEILFDPRRRGPALLLRAGEIGRAEAASILLALADDEEDAASQIDLFDVTSAASAREQLRLWHVDSGYREALAEMAA